MGAPHTASLTISKRVTFITIHPKVALVFVLIYYCNYCVNKQTQTKTYKNQAVISIFSPVVFNLIKLPLDIPA